MKNTKKLLVLAVAALLLVGVTVGGTMAWLQATSGTVTNTFTPAGIEIELMETKKPDGTVVEAGVTDWSAKLIPGEEYAKNPMVSLTEADTDVWLFVELDNADTDGFIKFDINTTNWKAVPGETNVWYRETAKTELDTPWEVLKDNKVTIEGEGLNEDNMPEEDLTMVFKAYALQKDAADDAATAWAQVSGN